MSTINLITKGIGPGSTIPLFLTKGLYIGTQTTWTIQAAVSTSYSTQAALSSSWSDQAQVSTSWSTQAEKDHTVS